MSKISNPWLTPLQRSYQQIKYRLLERLKDIKGPDGNPLITDTSEGNIFVILLSMFSAIAEVLHYYIDNMARETFFVTARRYDSLIKHAAMLDYRPKSATASRVDVVLSRDINDPSVSADFTIPAGITFTDNNGYKWRVESAKTWFSNTTTCKIPLIQDELKRVSSLNGNLIPSVEDQVILELPLPNDGQFYEHGSLAISIDGTPWSLVETLAYSKPQDKHYIVYMSEDGKVKITFGDGLFGCRPNANSVITSCTYRATQGVKGNIPSGSITSVPSSILTNVSSVTCNNPLSSAGGSNSEDFFKLKSSVPLSVKTLGVAITKEDYKNLAMLFPGVAKAAVEYECGRRITVYISPINGGVAPSNLLSAVQQYLKDRSPLTTHLEVKPVGEVNIQLDIDVTGNRSCSSQTIRKAIEDTLLRAYSPNNTEISSSVRISDIYALIDNLPVVDHLFINKFYTKPWPTTLSGNVQLVMDHFEIISSTDKNSMEYIVVFKSESDYQIRSKSNGYCSTDLKIGEVNRIEDINNGFIFSIGITSNNYISGFKYKFLVAKPNYDYTEPGICVPVFKDPSSQLTLNITEVL